MQDHAIRLQRRAMRCTAMQRDTTAMQNHTKQCETLQSNAKQRNAIGNASCKTMHSSVMQEL
eukprot:1372130-Pyramimonas_sp.AAC.1